MNKFSVLLSSLCVSISLVATETSASDVPSYRSICKLAAENDYYFSEFKNIQDYNNILEHLGKDHGQFCLDAIKQQTPDLIQRIETFKRNDWYGHPRQDSFPEIGTISCTTLRYLKVASDIVLTYGSSLNNKSIVEIGGGYGGQCLILSLIYQFKDYTIIDLPEPLALTKRYLEKHNIHNVIYKAMDTKMADKNYDLVISNYGFVECSLEMREKYTREVLSYSKNGYITGPKYPAIEFLDEYAIPYEIWSENPCTGSTNVLVVWNR